MNNPRPPVPLPQKLGIQPGYTVCVMNAPEGYMESLGAMLTQARIVRGMEDDADIIQAFVTTKADLTTSFPMLKGALGKPHALWICWPRAISGIQTDLKEDVIREIGLKGGLVDVKVATINQDWSGLKFVYRLQDR